MNTKEKPIGIFDSGIGGLTVLREILEVLPNESLIYLGDTARVPYGTRGKEVIERFALELTGFLVKKDVKFLVVACNTISATCLVEVEKNSPVQVLGVINPAVKEAVKVSREGRIGVIGTRATVGSGVYEKEIKKLNPQAKVVSQACPLFVPLAEEGLVGSEATKIIAQDYLSSLSPAEIDTLILGCTHYPALRDTIQGVVGSSVKLIDSAKPTALELKNTLAQNDLLNDGANVKSEFYVTDAPERVSQVAVDFLGQVLPGSLKKIDL